MPGDDWSLESLREMHDREIRALKELTAAEIRRLDEESETQVARQRESLEALRHMLDAMATERQNQQEKFEATVVSRFVQVNEFRGSLDDLGKTMATRRELEAALAGVRAETLTALDAAKGTTDELRTQTQELRSRIDVGPATLSNLQARSDQSVGAATRGKELAAYAFAAVAAAVSLVALAAALLR